MKLSQLLATRQSILRQARLANLAQAYVTLQRLAGRIATARLHGPVKLRPAAPAEERYGATLTALQGNQSPIEEQFTDEDLMELADAVMLAIGAEFAEADFLLEELADKFAAPLRQALDHAGVTDDLAGVQLYPLPARGLIE